MSQKSSVENEIKDLKMGRPHVVILGAGASLAAMPNGDKNGYKLPLMNNIIDTLGLKPILKSAKISYKIDNFEELYSDLYRKSEYAQIFEDVEIKIKGYFSNLELPKHPTLYDHLVLSLRKKDLIATFNWDPFLIDAYNRNSEEFDLPHLVFLHGNVSVGYCEKDRKKGPMNRLCGKCGRPFKPTKLLYPIKQKNYNDDEFIAAEWKTLMNFLEKAYVLTIFGYSAPTSDVEAYELMKKAWGDKYQRSLEEIEIIDLKSEDELLMTWENFIHTHHYTVYSNFYDSWTPRHPRRTCDAMWNRLMEIQYLDDNNIPINVDFNKLWAWLKPLKEAEKNK
jgi:hypothetical protein